MHFSTIAATIVSAAAVVSAGPVDKRSCQYSYPPAGLVEVSRTINPPSGGNAAVTFALPANTNPGPCTLQAVFPAGYPITNSGASRVNVFAVGGPAPGALVGTLDFVSDPTQPTVRTINSFTCRPSMSYTLSIASETQDGFVAFQDAPGAGLVMQYGC